MKSIRGASALLLALALISTLAVGLAAPATASPADTYTDAAPYFGAGNLPPGCDSDVLVGELTLVTFGTDPGASRDNVCHHMRTGLNALDSPQVDVLVMVPVSPTVERDMRIMRQSVEMWEGGIDYLAREMGLLWLAEGVDFHITVDSFDPAGDGGGEFTTYPIVDPEIVVIATNPVGGAGIGIDPFVDSQPNRCNAFPVGNPLDFEHWENLPGFDSHHGERSGTYVEDCSANGGGNVCYAVNGAIDPAPGEIEEGQVLGTVPFGIFDLVAHEFGHCLTLGHVGDGAEGAWGKVPTNDIMAYHNDPPGMTKCVSTLDVEGFAIRMSRYLDVDGDGVVGGLMNAEDDRLLANDQVGEGGNPFQIQHPRDHLYASSTGEVTGCPQPDLGPTPGPRTDWTPAPFEKPKAAMAITSPRNGAASESGIFDVEGTVDRPLDEFPEPAAPFRIKPAATFDDADADGTTGLPTSEILDLAVEMKESHVDATVHLAELWPLTAGASPMSVRLTIDGRTFDSFFYGTGTAPRTFDGGQGDVPSGYMPAGASKWNLDEKTVEFHIPRFKAESSTAPADEPRHLAASGALAPYEVSSNTTDGVLGSGLFDDWAPERGAFLKVGPAATDTDGDSVPDSEDKCAEPGNHPITGCPDADFDGVVDAQDACPAVGGSGPAGCPPGADDEVQLWVGGAIASTDAVDTSGGRDRFKLPVGLPEGTHKASVRWVGADGVEIDRASLTLTHTPTPAQVTNPPTTGGEGGTTTPNTGGGTSPTPVDRPAAGTRPPGATPAPAPSDSAEGTIEEAILTRVHGADRVATSVAASLAAFNDRSAEVAVLARSDSFADGLAGTSLAVAFGGPLLLTPDAGLDPRVADELRRVLPQGSTVFVLGGPAALRPEVDSQLQNLGFSVKRLAGRDRFETAALVARAQPRHETILVATGQNFADALAAGAAAAQARGTVVLTDNGSLPQSTADYLAEHPGAEVFAIGGPAAGALPGAHKLVGADRFDTSVQVAAMFFEAPSLVGLASGVSFPDALSGGALLGRFSGPLLLTAPDRLVPIVAEYLGLRAGTVDDLFVIGGENAVARPVVEDALEALRR